MNRLKIAYRVLALAAAVLFLVSCSHKTPLGAAPTQTPKPSAVSATGSPAPTVSGTDINEPADTLEPEPLVPTPHPQVTYGPMATPGPVSTPIPLSAPLTDNDYYIIDKNWCDEQEELDSGGYYSDDNESACYCYGVLDAHGNVVLPFEYLSINDIKLRANGNSGKKYHYFFAEEYADVDGKVVSDSGFFYNTKGAKACDTRFNSMQIFSKNRFAAQRSDNSFWGVMTPDFQVVIPFQYQAMVCFGDWIAAQIEEGNGQCRIDFYDRDCTLKGNLEVGKKDIYGIDDDLLGAWGTNGKLGFVDKSMAWCAEPQWDGDFTKSSGYDNEDDYGPGYLVTIGRKHYNVNKYGKAFIPKGVDPTACMQVYDSSDENLIRCTLDGHYLYIYTEEEDDGQGDAKVLRGMLFNDLGTILYQANGEDSAYTKDIAIDGGKRVNLSGNVSLPGDTDETVYDQCGYYEDENRDGFTEAVYTKDGRKLPLPEDFTYECISKDRFIARTSDGNCGICNEQGQWLLTPRNIYVDTTNSWMPWPVFSVDYADGDENTHTQYGVLDTNGRVIYDAIFDLIQPLSESRGLYEVDYHGIHGVIDAGGHWLWYANSMNDLQD